VPLLFFEFFKAIGEGGIIKESFELNWLEAMPPPPPPGPPLLRGVASLLGDRSIERSLSSID